ncbi:MAG: succinylglutamate desuccinylase/aspartoacylase family protein [Rhodospirillales bacterium]
MRTETIPLPPAVPGVAHTLTVHRFGEPGARPKVHFQGALHADEIPGMIAAVRLRDRLIAEEAAGRIAGEIVLVPAANPIGLAQQVLGGPIGRFDLADGQNCNRGFPSLTEGAAVRLDGRLDGNAEANRAEANRIRVAAALRAELDARPAHTPAEHLKRTLLDLAIDADIVLDLHCDSEAVVHLYTLTRSADAVAPLAALLGSRATLLADVSGDDPFDEACSRPWAELQERFPDRPLGPGCTAVTVELRGQADVADATADADADALVAYLRLAGALSGPRPVLARPACPATPLAGTEPVTTPVGGIVVFRRAVGAVVAAGDPVADVVDPLTGAATTVRAGTSGVLFARASGRFAHPGKRLAKIAGGTPLRSGRLLSP